MEGVSSSLAVSSVESSKIASRNVGPDQMTGQGCLPSSIRAALSFVSGHSILQQKEFLQSYTDGEAYLPARLENGLNLQYTGAKENPIVIEDEQDENAISDIPTCPELCLNSSPMEHKSSHYLQKHSYVYKRRKLQGNSVTLMPKQTQIADGKDCLSNFSECYDESAFPFPYLRYSMLFLQSENNDINSQSNGLSEDGKYNVCVENCVDCEIPSSEGISSYLKGSSDLLLDTGKTDMNIIDVEEASSESRSIIEDSINLQGQSCSSYNNSDCNLGQIAASVEHDLIDVPDCTSRDDVTHLSRETDPEKEWCISVLKESGLLGRFVPSRDCTAAGHPGVVGDGSLPQLCKICGSLEDSTRTLICDMCEEAFHMSCCNPKVKSVPAQDDWYCQFCKRKRNKPGNKRLIESKCHQNRVKVPCTHVDKSASDKAELFSRMLEDSEPYTTQARIGMAFQADVPDWTGKISDDAEMSFMGEPLEKEFPEKNLLNEVWTKGWKPAHSILPGSMENWLQCQNVIVMDGACSEGQKTNDVICGKWRRAPLYEVQNDDWDCSCSVVWDPVHADCIVPQELETEEIMMRLKATETAKLQCANKKRKTK